MHHTTIILGNINLPVSEKIATSLDGIVGVMNVCEKCLTMGTDVCDSIIKLQETCIQGTGDMHALVGSWHIHLLAEYICAKST